MDHEISPVPAALVGNGLYGGIVSHQAADPTRTDESDQRWMRDLMVLQVTSLFAAGLFMVVWLMH